MNFVAALLYAAVRDEVLAFGLMMKAMFELNWREVYKDELIMVLIITKKILAWLKKEHKSVAARLLEAEVILEAQLSSPIMALFANLVPLEASLRILDRFML